MRATGLNDDWFWREQIYLCPSEIYGDTIYPLNEKGTNIQQSPWTGSTMKKYKGIKGMIAPEEWLKLKANSGF